MTLAEDSTLLYIKEIEALKKAFAKVVLNHSCKYGMEVPTITQPLGEGVVVRRKYSCYIYNSLEKI
jgi:hypothetical protein